MTNIVAKETRRIEAEAEAAEEEEEQEEQKEKNAVKMVLLLDFNIQSIGLMLFCKSSQYFQSNQFVCCLHHFLPFISCLQTLHGRSSGS